jgi:DNA-binding transcriptional regulator YiaG
MKKARRLPARGERPSAGAKPSRRGSPALEDGIHASSTSEESRLGVAVKFSDCLKRIRRALHSKQIALSNAIGCTDAAISLWESGARVPTPRSFVRLLTALAAQGSSKSDLHELRRVWIDESANRRMGGRRVGSPNSPPTIS